MYTALLYHQTINPIFYNTSALLFANKASKIKFMRDGERCREREGEMEKRRRGSVWSPKCSGFADGVWITVLSSEFC